MYSMPSSASAAAVFHVEERLQFPVPRPLHELVPDLHFVRRLFVRNRGRRILAVHRRVPQAMAERIGVRHAGAEIIHRRVLVNLLFDRADGVVAGLIGPVAQPAVVHQRGRSHVGPRRARALVGIEHGEIIRNLLEQIAAVVIGLPASMPCQVTSNAARRESA